jgi:hypothetical protein
MGQEHGWHWGKRLSLGSGQTCIICPDMRPAQEAYAVLARDTELAGDLRIVFACNSGI